MSFNKNNPKAMGKIMGLLRQLSTDMGSEQQRRSGQGDEERLYRNKGPKYARVPSKPTLSASTTSTSLATSCGSQATLTPNTYAAIPETVSTESSDEDEQEDFEKTRLHFQQLRQVSLGTDYKYKMEMEIQSTKEENLRNSVPFVRQLSTDTMKSKKESARSVRDGSYSTTSGPTTHKLYLRTQVLAALAVSMGSMVVGYSSGYTSPALVTMQHENNTVKVTKDEASWVGGIMPLTALVGGVLGGPLIEYVGRRNTILATAIPFIVAWLCIATAFNVPMILTGRAISGFCVGIASLSFPVYLGETVQPEVRGSLGLLPTAFGNTGILIIYTAGKYLDWSQLAYLGAALPVPFLVLMMLIPETPRWYITHNNRKRAYSALQWLRGKGACIEHEIRDIENSLKEANKTSGSTFFLLFSRTYYRPVLISLGLMFFQQLSGINAVIFYTVQIFQSTGSTIDGNLSSIIIGLVNFVSTFIATVLIDRLGRKILLYISAISMILSLGVLGAFFYVRDVAGLDVQQISWLPVLCCMVYVLGFSLGFGPIPWLMMGEILPGKIRGSAASVATGFNWLCTFIVTKTFLDILNVLGAYGTFWLFAGITLVGLFFVIFFVPETQGKSLEEIENKLTGRVRRMSSVANLKPLPNGF